jgi:hypothetical protein
VSIQRWVPIIPILSFFIGFAVTYTAPEPQYFDLSSQSVLGTTYETFVRGIYQTYHDVTRYSVKKAAPYIVKWKIKEFLSGLPVQDEVKKNIMARLNVDENVADSVPLDEVIPFLWALKTQYWIEKDTEFSFDAWARQNISKLAPGGEHSLFQFSPKSDGQTTTGFSFKDEKNKQIAAQLVTLYHALFIVPRISPLRAELKPTDEMVKRVSQIVRELLKSFQAQLKATDEIGSSIEKLADDNESLEAVTASLIMAVHRETYKAYQSFVRKIDRQEKLLAWMKSHKRSPALLEYLIFAQNDRRFAIHAVVDGLQGS